MHLCIALATPSLYTLLHLANYLMLGLTDNALDSLFRAVGLGGNLINKKKGQGTTTDKDAPGIPSAVRTL